MLFWQGKGNSSCWCGNQKRESWSWFLLLSLFFLFIKQQTEQLFLCHETQTKVCLDEHCSISKTSLILSFCFGVNCPALSGGTIQEQGKAKVSKYKSKTLPCARQPNCYMIWIWFILWHFNTTPSYKAEQCQHQTGAYRCSRSALGPTSPGGGR